MLWCNLRSTSDLLLQKVFEIFHYSNSASNFDGNDKKNEAIHEITDVNENENKTVSECTRDVDITSPLPSINYSLYTKEEFSVFDMKVTENTLTENNENSSFITPPEFEKKIITQKLDPRFNFLTFIESSLFTKFELTGDKLVDNKNKNDNSSNNNDDDKSKSLLRWLRNWLNDEAKFCQNCINNTDSWNYGISRQMSLRYYAFILTKIIKYLLNSKIINDENLKLEGTSDFRIFLSDIQEALTRTTGQLLEEGN